ncbi:SPASM domain-containing protein [Candidatus Poribacteria bacterium]|nr:SPASM domain-containing protein [Candidatus Poribacteria bacterium]
MKLSQFTIFVPLGKKYLVFNTFNQATAVIGEKSRNILNNLPENPDKEEQKYIDKFTELGFIVDESADEAGELKDWYDKARRDTSILRATVLTTYDCNFACEYCVEEGVKTSIRMDDECSQAVVDWFVERAELNNTEKIVLLFYGGEPLMNPRPIEYIASRLHEYCDQNRLSFIFTITTNGSLLKPELMERLTPLGLKSVKVTLDGDKEAHDKKRPYKNGKGSFDRIVKNLIQVSDEVGIKIGVNIDKENLESVPRMLDYLDEIGLKEKIEQINFSPIVNIENQYGELKPTKQADCVSASEDWAKEDLVKLKWEALNRGFNVDTNANYTVCSMNRDGTVLVIDPVGRMYTCPAFVGREGFEVGDVYSQELSQRHEDLIGIEVPEECFKCAYMPYCDGGCKHAAYVKYGDMSKLICEMDFIERSISETLKMKLLSRIK